MTWPSLESIGTSFKEALAALASRAVIATPDREEIEAGAAAEAFWISDVALLSVVSDVYDSIESAVATGTSFESWRTDVIGALRANYPEDMTDAEVDHRVELVFRNSTQRAYSEGRYAQAQHPVVLRAKPYFMYDAILDARTTSLCQGLNGTIRAQNDPFWDTHVPPLHHNCRSGLRTLSAEQVADRGGETAVTPDTHAAAGFGARPGTTDAPRPESDRYAPPLNAALHARAQERGA